MKVKYTSSKWFLENNGEWIEIDENDFNKIFGIIWMQEDIHNSSWKPTPDTEYQLPEDVGFEISKICQCEIEGCRSCMCPEVAHLKVEQESQLIKFGENSIYPDPSKTLIDVIKLTKRQWEIQEWKRANPDKYIKGEKYESNGQMWDIPTKLNQKEQLYISELSELLAIMHGDGGHHENKVGTLQAIKDAQELIYTKWVKQEQNEVERLREEIKQWKERQIFLEDQHLEDLDKIQELESKLSQFQK